MKIASLALAAVLAGFQPAAAEQTTSSPPPTGTSPVDGYVSLLLDYLPDTQRALELRARVFAEGLFTAGDRVTLKVGGFAEGLAADRDGTEIHGIVRPRDLYADFDLGRADLLVGFTRIVWGRLDEFQPGDVVNPLDITRFFLEGRNEARLPVALVRGRLFLPRDTTLEAVLVPVFRPGRFDQMHEPSSPFNLAANPQVCLPVVGCAPVEIDRKEPSTSMENVQGGLRLSATTGRIDWAVAAFYGFEPFGLFDAVSPSVQVRLSSGAPAGPPSLRVNEVFPRFLMVAGDFEMVRGGWALRGELAAFPRDNFQRSDPGSVGIVRGSSFEGGFGVEKEAGDFRVSGNLLVARASESTAVEDTHVSLVGAVDRSFRRDTLRLRTFGVVNAGDESAFLRTIAAVSLRDNVWLEGSGGWFVGSGTDNIGRFSERDFVYAQLKVYF